MKKKIALLLVLSMILSLMPMNVFGAPLGGSGSVPNPMAGSFSTKTENNVRSVHVGQSDIWFDILSHNNTFRVQTVNNMAPNDIAKLNAYFGANNKGYDTLFSTGVAKTTMTISLNLVGGKWAGPDFTTGTNHSTRVDVTSDGALHTSRDLLVGVDAQQHFDWGDDHAAGASHMGVVGLKNNTGAPIAGPEIYYAFIADSATSARIIFYADARVFPDAFSNTSIGLAGNQYRYMDPVLSYVQDDAATSVVLNIDGELPLTLTNVANRGLNAAVRTPSNFSTYAYFDSLDISEIMRGDIHNGSTTSQTPFITFWAPDYYKWVRPGNGQVITGHHNMGNQSYTFGYTTRYDNEANARLRISGQQGNTGDHAARYYIDPTDKYLTVALPVDYSNLTGAAERFGLQGIGLVADDRAPLNQVVNVKYVVTWINDVQLSSTTSTRYLTNPDGSYVFPRNPDNSYDYDRVEFTTAYPSPTGNRYYRDTGGNVVYLKDVYGNEVTDRGLAYDAYNVYGFVDPGGFNRVPLPLPAQETYTSSNWTGPSTWSWRWNSTTNVFETLVGIGTADSSVGVPINSSNWVTGTWVNGTWVGNWNVGGTIATYTPWTNPIDHDDSRWRSIPVGTRTYDDVLFGIKDGETIPAIRSGKIEEWTAWTVLRENAANALGANLSLDVTYRVPEGVTIRAAEVKMPNLVGDVSTLADPKEFRADAGNNLGSWNYASSEGVLVTPDYLRITPAINDWGNRSYSRSIEVRLKVSIEAGYEWKYENTDLEITVEGTALSKLMGDNSAIAATIYDPITLEVEDTTAIIVNNDAYNVQTQEIGDIIITEAKAAELKKGSELWVYVIGNRAAEVEFTCDPTAIVDSADSQLLLNPGKILRHRWSSTWVNGMSFTVERQSRPGRNDEDGAGTIIITGGRITGPVYPGIEYQVVVSGNAVADNDYTVYENGLPTNTSFTTANDNRWWLYNAEPYAVAAFEYDEEGNAPPESEAPDSGSSSSTTTPPASVPSATIRSPLVLNVGSPAIDGVKPFVMAPYGPGVAYGAISAKVFSDFVNGTASWDSPVATVTGTHNNGSVVTVELTSGSASATIDGETVDIATYSALGYAPGTVTPYMSADGRMYLPLRFLCNAFGITPEWNPATSTVTIH